MNFKIFLENEEQKNVLKLLHSLPKKHRTLLKGYKFKYTPNNTLAGDNNHIGYIHRDKIVVAAPWNYSRSFTTLHEIAHLVWEKLMDEKLKSKWSDLVKKTLPKQKEKFKHPAQKDALDQGVEEIFCMAYAASFSTHSPTIWYNDEWVKFMHELAN